MNNSGAIDVGLVNSGAVLTLDDNTSVTGGTITVYSGNSLHVENGTTGASSVTVTLDDVNVDLHNSGTIQVEIIPPGGSSAATIDLQLTSGSIVNGGTLSIGGAGEVEVGSGGATFDGGLTVSNQGAISVTTSTLTLAGATVEGGTITNNGTIDVAAGSSKIDDNATFGGSVQHRRDRADAEPG